MVSVLVSSWRFHWPPTANWWSTPRVKGVLRLPSMIVSVASERPVAPMSFLYSVQYALSLEVPKSHLPSWFNASELRLSSLAPHAPSSCFSSAWAMKACCTPWPASSDTSCASLSFHCSSASTLRSFSPA
ncbi:hypothetical protein D3C71_783340 [compost metagenome]